MAKWPSCPHRKHFMVALRPLDIGGKLTLLALPAPAPAPAPPPPPPPPPATGVVTAGLGAAAAAFFFAGDFASAFTLAAADCLAAALLGLRAGAAGESALFVPSGPWSGCHPVPFGYVASPPT